MCATLSNSAGSHAARAFNVLLVDDDRALADLLREYLRPSGLMIEAVHDGVSGLRAAASGDYAAVILDVMLPGLNGLDVLRQLRAQSNVPVLMLTARGEDVDRIVGLEVGADDYLPKPFNPRELAARLHAILRRTGAATERPGPGDRIAIGDVELCPAARSVTCAGRAVSLTGTEFTLVESLLKSAGCVITRDELCRSVLDRILQPYDRSIDMHVSNVRRKLGPAPDGSERIRSIRGTGYIFVVPAPRAALDHTPPKRTD